MDSLLGRWGYERHWLLGVGPEKSHKDGQWRYYSSSYCHVKSGQKTNFGAVLGIQHYFIHLNKYQQYDKSSMCSESSSATFRQLRHTYAVHWRTYSFFPRTDMLTSFWACMVEPDVVLERWLLPQFSIISFTTVTLGWPLPVCPQSGHISIAW